MLTCRLRTKLVLVVYFVLFISGLKEQVALFSNGGFKMVVEKKLNKVFIQFNIVV